MKRLLSISIVLLLVLCGCTSSNKKDKEESKKALSDVQQNDINIANDLTKASDIMEQLQSLHMNATTQHGEVYDMNVSGTNYAGTHTHIVTVNGVNQQTTDYEYEKDGVQSSYMTISGKTLPFSNNFCPYMISTMASDARRYVDMISTEPVENYESIFTLTDNGDGTRTIVTIGETSMTYVLNAENWIVNTFSDNYLENRLSVVHWSKIPPMNHEYGHYQTN